MIITSEHCFKQFDTKEEAMYSGNKIIKLITGWWYFETYDVNDKWINTFHKDLLIMNQFDNDKYGATVFGFNCPLDIDSVMDLYDDPNEAIYRALTNLSDFIEHHAIILKKSITILNCEAYKLFLERLKQRDNINTLFIKN